MKQNLNKKGFTPHLLRGIGGVKSKYTKKGGGFTLIELIIAIAIFIIVVSVVLSLFITGLQGQRKVIALQNVQDNARFLMNFMVKEIRMSEIISADPYGYSLVIKRHDDQEITYNFDGANNIQRIITGDPYGSGPINSEEVSVTGNFYSLGIGKDDGQQPRVTIVMKVETTGGAEEKAEVSLQATLSPRNLEL